jgi:hypothetical protein
MLLRNPTVKKIRRLVARAHYDGMQFHRKEVQQDPTLWSGVLSDSRLPAGWEALLARMPERQETSWVGRVRVLR